MARRMTPEEAKLTALARWKPKGQPPDDLERQRRSFEASERAHARWAKHRKAKSK
jgi:hypothetical protein